MCKRFIFYLFMLFFAVSARAMEDEKTEKRKTNLIDIEHLDEDVGRSDLQSPNSFSRELDSLGGMLDTPDVLAPALAKKFNLHNRCLPKLKKVLEDKTDRTELKRFLFSGSGKGEIKKKGLSDLVSNVTKDPEVPLSVVKFLVSTLQNKGEDDQRNLNNQEVRITESEQLIAKQKKTIRKKNWGLLGSLGCNGLTLITGIVAFGTLGLDVYTTIKGCNVDGVNGVATNSTLF